LSWTDWGILFGLAGRRSFVEWGCAAVVAGASITSSGAFRPVPAARRDAGERRAGV